MEFLQKQPRNQLSLYTTCLDDMIGSDNMVRAIDTFVDNLDLNALGFKTIAATGRPPYNPADLLKLYIYGYMNRMRSSRLLELECKRNIELIWLLGHLKPDHNTISRFRKQNPKAIKRVFRATVAIAKNHNLIGAVIIAGDSTKLRAQNSKKNNYNKKKVQRHIDYIDNKIELYNTQLDQADDNQENEILKQIKKHKKQRQRYKDIQKQLVQDKTSVNPQLSTSDPDSRHQIIRANITEVSYTAQTTVDHKHKLLIDYKVTNANDKKAMGNMLRRAKTILRTNAFVALYDKGYHTGSEFKTAHDLGIKTLVAIPAIGRAAQAPNPNYNVEHFKYLNDKDLYICPQGEQLTSNGNWYKARNYRFKQYKTKACKTCPVKHLCTTAKHNGKIVQRSEFKQYIEDNAIQVQNNKELYRKRQAIVEHPYGTIKRQWGFDYIITKKGIKSASAEIGLMCIAYNLKRLFNLGYKTYMALKTALYKLICNAKAFFKLIKSFLTLDLINHQKYRNAQFLIHL